MAARLGVDIGGTFTDLPRGPSGAALRLLDATMADRLARMDGARP